MIKLNKLKPLKWKRLVGVINGYEAETPLGFATVEFKPMGKFKAFFIGIRSAPKLPENKTKLFDNLEDAKAFANGLYENLAKELFTKSKTDNLVKELSNLRPDPAPFILVKHTRREHTYTIRDRYGLILGTFESCTPSSDNITLMVKAVELFIQEWRSIEDE